MATKIGVVLALNDEEKFANGMKKAQESVRQLDSAIKGLSEQYAGNANSAEALSAKQDLLKQKEEACERALTNAKSARSKAVEAYRQQAKAVDELAESLSKAQKEGNQSEADKYQKKLAAAQKELSRLDLTITKWDGNVSRSQKSLSEASSETRRYSGYMDEASKSADNCATSIDKMGNEIKDAGANAAQSGSKLSGLIQDIGAGAVSRIGSNITDSIMSIPGKLVDAAQKALEVGSSFEAAMSNVGAISGATGQDFEALAAKAEEMGRTTKFSATEAADAMSYMAMAGWKTDDMLNGISGIMDLAAASGEDLATTSDIVTDALTAFGLKASDSAHFADIMAAASSNANTNVSLMGETFKYCAPIAGSLGFTAEDTAEAIGLMANSGIKATQAGTALRTIMTKMSSSIKITTASGKEMVVHTKNADGSMRSLSSIIADCRDKFSKLSESEKANAAKSIAGQEAMSGFLALMNAGQGDVDKLSSAIQNCDGAAAGMAKTMQDNLKGAATEFGSAAEGLGIALYDKVKGPLTEVVKLGTDMVTGLTGMIAPAKSQADEVAESFDQISQSVRENGEQIDSSVDAYQAQSSQIDHLVDTIYRMASAENKTAADKANLRDRVEELNAIVPNLNLSYDEEADKLSATRGEVEKLTQAYKDQVVQQTLISLQKKAVQDNVTAKYNLEMANQELDALKERRDLYEELSQYAHDQFTYGEGDKQNWTGALKSQEEAVKALNDAYDKGILSTDEYQKALEAVQNAGYGVQDSVDALDKSWSGLDESVDSATKKQKEAAKAVGESDKELQKSQKTVDSLADSTGKHTASMQQDAIWTRNGTAATDENTASLKENTDEINDNTDAKEKFVLTTEAAEKMQRDYAQSVVDAYDKLRESTKQTLKLSITSEFEGGDDQTTEKMNANLKSQIEGYQKYAENLAKVREYCSEGIITPEFLTNLESMGTEGANILEHITWTMENQGEYGLDQIKSLSDAYMESLNMQDKISIVLADDKVTLEEGLKDLGSPDADFADLRAAIESAFSEADQTAKSSLDSLVSTAQQMGVKIPDGLEEGISNSTIDADTAIQELQSAITGQMEGLSDVLSKSGDESGKKLVDQLKSSLESGDTSGAIEAYKNLLNKVSETEPDTTAPKDTGKKAGEEYTAGVKETQEANTSAVQEVSDTAWASIKTETAKEAGEKTGKDFAEGIRSAASIVQQISKELAKSASEALNSGSGDESQAGSSMSGKIAGGISADAIAQAVVKAMADASKAASDSTTDEPGRIFSDKIASGIGSNASKIAEAAKFAITSGKNAAQSIAASFVGVGQQMSNGIAAGMGSRSSVIADVARAAVRNAVNAAKAEGGIHSPSAVMRDQVGRWLSEGVAVGIDAYSATAVEAAARMANQTVQAAQAAMAQASGTVGGLFDGIGNNFGVSRWTYKKVKKGKKTTTKKDKKKSDTDYYNEIEKAAETHLNHMEAIQDVSTQDELRYWKAVQSRLTGGTDAWYTAQSKINSLAEKIGSASVAKSLLSELEQYQDVSEKAAVQYWQTVRNQYATGSANWIESNKNLISAQKNYEKKLTDIQKTYADKRKEIIEKEAQTVKDRANEIAKSFDIFDKFESKSETGETLLFNMKAQAAGYQDWRTQLDKLEGRGILSKELIEILKDKGPEQSAAIHALNELSDKELKEYQTAFDQKMAAATAQAREDTQQQVAELEAQRIELEQSAADDINKLNTSLSDGMVTLAQNIHNFTTEQTSQILSVLQAGGSYASAAAAAAPPPQASTPPPAAPARTDKILDIINKGAPHSKKLSAKEKREHVPLWEYIATKYGRTAGTNMYKSLASALGIKVGKTVSSAEKEKILKALKKRGYASGSAYITEDQLALVDELGEELRISKAGRLAYLQKGDGVIPANLTKNLMDWGKFSPAVLSRAVNGAAVNAALMRVGRTAAEPMTQAVEVLAGRADRTEAMLSQLVELVDRISRMQINMDGEKVGSIVTPIVSGNMAKSIRRFRG